MIVAFEIIFLFIKLLSLDFWSSSSSQKQFKPELVIIFKKSTHLRDFFSRMVNEAFIARHWLLMEVVSEYS